MPCWRHFTAPWGVAYQKGPIASISPIGSENVNGRTYATLNTVSQAPAVPGKQKVYAILDKGYMLMFVMTYSESSQLDEMVGILKSAEFERAPAPAGK